MDLPTRFLLRHTKTGWRLNGDPVHGNGGDYGEAVLEPHPLSVEAKIWCGPLAVWSLQQGRGRHYRVARGRHGEDLGICHHPTFESTAALELANGRRYAWERGQYLSWPVFHWVADPPLVGAEATTPLLMFIDEHADLMSAKVYPGAAQNPDFPVLLMLGFGLLLHTTCS